MSEDLRVIRKRKGLSINQLASKTGIPITQVIRYEKGAEEIPYNDLRQLAKALYVDEWDINQQSTPPPPPRKEQPERPARQPKPKPKQEPEPKKKASPKSSPARETQITHLLRLIKHFDLDQDALEAQIGKPLKDLTQQEARHWNRHYTERIIKEKNNQRPIDRKRAYLPEGVDGFELAYLQEQQEANALLHFTLFDGQTFEGSIVGFSPYHIVIHEPDGDEITLNKLAIAYYRKAGEGSEE